MNQPNPDELDARLAQLERESEPSRDLWPAIAAAIAMDAVQAPGPLNVHRLTPRASRFKVARIWQLAASVLLMVGSSAVTYFYMQRSQQAELAQVRQQTVQQMQPVLAAMPASFGYQQLGTDYARTHAQLNGQFERYLATLPAAQREPVERSLGDRRRAARELSARLAEHPSDELLQELLMSTYQNELGLLNRANDMGAETALGADL